MIGTEYHKIDTVFARNTRGKIIEGTYANQAFAYLADNMWWWTEKVDGTNARLSYDASQEFRGNEHAYVAGKTDNAQLAPTLLLRLVELLKAMPMETVFGTELDTAVTLYGEGYGNRIGKAGHLYRPDGVDFVLFDVNVAGWWLSRENVEDVAQKLGLDVVPIVGTGTLTEAVEKVREGFDSLSWGVLAEGLVMRPDVELFARDGSRIITKIKRKDFR
jgi:hypothetical protein